jgi:hypothetical protein
MFLFPGVRQQWVSMLTWGMLYVVITQIRDWDARVVFSAGCEILIGVI